MTSPHMCQNISDATINYHSTAEKMTWFNTLICIH